jgi:beta-glucosidase
MERHHLPARCEFPQGFLWGAATSAYQIEGGTTADGRTASIWDRFCSVPGNVQDGSSGEQACDHYARFREDVRLMQDIGLRAYRFSISWNRILPQGRGALNHKGLEFYERLVDALLEAEIQPFATLFHWDLPQALQDEGGWAARGTVDAFAEYADVLGRRLGDRVRHWITHNEPWCVTILGNQQGRHAPGLRSWQVALATSHHLLLSHGAAVRALRSVSGASQIGIALNLVPAVPASPSEADRDATRHFDGFFNRWFLDPLHGRGYPQDMLRDYEAAGRLPPDWHSLVRGDDLRTIAEPADFLGVNYYRREVVRSTAVSEARNAPRTVHLPPDDQLTTMGWEIHPEAMFDILERVHAEYAPRCLYITENGASFRDVPAADGAVADVDRIAFVRAHLREARRAIAAGIPLRGYFLWSLLDNFEWERGYGPRFGLVRVDYHTQQRSLKQSAHWYRDVIRANAVEL